MHGKVEMEWSLTHAGRFSFMLNPRPFCQTRLFKPFEYISSGKDNQILRWSRDKVIYKDCPLLLNVRDGPMIPIGLNCWGGELSEISDELIGK